VQCSNCQEDFEPEGDESVCLRCLEEISDGSVQEVFDLSENEALFAPEVTTSCTVRITDIEIIDSVNQEVLQQDEYRVAGRLIHLKVRPVDRRSPLTDIAWNIAGETVASYEPNDDSATIEEVDEGDLGEDEVSFHWIEGGECLVSVSATVNGKSCQAFVNFEVGAPTDVSITTDISQSKVQLGKEESSWYMSYGGRKNITSKEMGPGIRWTCTATAPADGDGQIVGVQLIHNYRWRKLTEMEGGRTIEETIDTKKYVLDDAFPYGDPVDIEAEEKEEWVEGDTPGTPLTGRMGYRVSEVSVVNKFVFYFMYKPSGGESIWITLAALSWYWEADLLERRVDKADLPTYGDGRDFYKTDEDEDSAYLLDEGDIFNVKQLRQAPRGKLSSELPVWDACNVDFDWKLKS
jgi:hypothetical protein